MLIPGWSFNVVNDQDLDASVPGGGPGLERIGTQPSVFDIEQFFESSVVKDRVIAEIVQSVHKIGDTDCPAGPSLRYRIFRCQSISDQPSIQVN
jgi:hypothetical protein